MISMNHPHLPTLCYVTYEILVAPCNTFNLPLLHSTYRYNCLGKNIFWGTFSSVPGSVTVMDKPSHRGTITRTVVGSGNPILINQPDLIKSLTAMSSSARLLVRLKEAPVIPTTTNLIPSLVGIENGRNERPIYT